MVADFFIGTLTTTTMSTGVAAPPINNVWVYHDALKLAGGLVLWPGGNVLELHFWGPIPFSDLGNWVVSSIQIYSSFDYRQSRKDYIVK